MNNNDRKEFNYITISKPGYISTKNKRGQNHSLLTFKEGGNSVKIEMNSSSENKINKSNILQTITDYKRKIVILEHHRNNNLNNQLKLNYNRARYSKNNLINDKTFNGNNIGKLINIEKDNIEKNNISNNIGDNDIRVKEEILNPDITQIIIKNNNSMEIDNKKEDEEKDIEDNLVSSINKKSIKTQQIIKEIQKSKQISDKAEISKVNSDSDNFTDIDYKLKSSMKIKYINGNNIIGLIGSNINENEEIENEILDNKDLISFVNNENKNKKIENIDNNEVPKIEKNNFFIKENEDLNKKTLDNNSIIENNDSIHIIQKNEKNIRKNSVKKESNTIKKDEKSELIDDVTSENRKLIRPIPIQENEKNIQKDLNDLNNKDIDENAKINQIKFSKLKELQKTISTSTVFSNNPNKIQMSKTQNLISNSMKPNKMNKIINNKYQSIQKDCYICEKSFYFMKLVCSECGEHFLCPKCLKNYYEDYLESKNFSKDLKCPCVQCGQKMDYEKIKESISETHQQIYENEKKQLDIRGKDIFDSNRDTKIKMYTNKNVLDVNSNKNIFMYKKSKDQFCPRCLKPYLFTKTNNSFFKCLFCNLKICRFCLKEYNAKHLNIQDENHCKIGFRREMEEEEQKGIKSIILNYLKELFFVVVTYILIYPGIFFTLLFFTHSCLRINKKKANINYYFKCALALIISIIFFIICCPFIIIIYSIFPSFIAIFDI